MKLIDKDRIIKNLERSNPWWGGQSMGFENLPRRVHFDRLYRFIKQKDPVRALVLMGPRRVGKTVLLYQMIHQLIAEGQNPKKILYLSLDNPVFRFSSLEELFQWGLEWAGVSAEDAVVFFDEVQFIDTWEQQLKVLVDGYRKTKFVVTGSAAAVLNKKSKESGAGRFTTYLLPSLSFYEYIFIKGALEDTPERIIDLSKMNSLYLEYLNYGSFPESITSEAVRNQPDAYIGQEILDKVLGRDLPGLYGISNPNELHRLFTALAYNTSNEVSPDNISQQAGVAKAEINKYIEFLENAFLVKVIEKTDDTLKKFQRRTHFKVVLTNPSLRSAIFGKISADDKDLEPLAETAVYSQLMTGKKAYSPYKYARWNRGGSKGEVDLVHITPKNKIASAVEIKWSDRFALEDESPKSLISFCRDNQLRQAVMTSKTVFSKTQVGQLEITHIPTSFFCFAVGMLGGMFDTLEQEESAEALAKELLSFSGMRYLTRDLIDHLRRLLPQTVRVLVGSA